MAMDDMDRDESLYLKNVIPLTSLNKMSQDTINRCCACKTCKKNKHKREMKRTSCEACRHLSYLLDTYFHSATEQSSDDIVNAIWSMHETKMQLHQLLKQSSPRPEALENLHQIQEQLVQLNNSFTRLSNTHPLSYFLAMITKETELLIMSKTSKWWRRLHEI